MTAVWIAVGVVAFIGLFALFGWYRHKLEFEKEQVGAMLWARARSAWERLQNFPKDVARSHSNLLKQVAGEKSEYAP